MGGRVFLTRARALAGVAVLVAVVAACGPSAGDGAGAVAMPPDTASPFEVLNAYLGAMRGGDCATAHRLFVEPTQVGNGDLCGKLTLFAYRLSGDPLVHGATEIIQGTTLTTSGSGDGSIPAGDYLWSYDVVRQPSGVWRIVSAGQG